MTIMLGMFSADILAKTCFAVMSQLPLVFLWLLVQVALLSLSLSCFILIKLKSVLSVSQCWCHTCFLNVTGVHHQTTAQDGVVDIKISRINMLERFRPKGSDSFLSFNSPNERNTNIQSGVKYILSGRRSSRPVSRPRTETFASVTKMPSTA